MTPAHIYPADIWRQWDVGMMLDSDIRLTLQEGRKWRSTINTESVPQLSWRKIRSISGFILVVDYAVTSRRLKESNT